MGINCGGEIMEKIYYPLEENLGIVKKIYSESFINDSINDELCADYCMEANEQLAKYVYGVQIADLLRNGEISAINSMYKDLKKKNEFRKDFFSDINFNNTGLILVRPENIGLVSKYEKFLNSLDLDIIYKKYIKINFEQYWLLYHHGLICEDAVCDFPTRTLNYANKLCCLLVVRTIKDIVQPLPDYLNSIKGKQGKFQTGTLRGEIGYNGLKNIVTSDGIYFNEKLNNLLFDPTGMCRLLSRGKIKSDNSHEIADLKLLFYVGQTVHVPDYSEILDDISVLCDENDAKKIKQKIKNK